MSATLVHIVAAGPVPIYGVFTSRDGDPLFKLVALWGTMQVVNDDVETRLVTGFCVDDHVEAADFKPDFVGFTTDKTDTRPWLEKAKAKAKKWNERIDAEAKQKILMPNKKLVGFENN